jgi:hypothetical protein
VKLPYRTGDSFELPLGNGESAPATIVASHHHFVEIAVADRVLRVYDGAFALHRWHVVRPAHHDTKVPVPTTCHLEPGQRTVSPARLERTIAAHLGVALFDDATRAVYEMHDEITAAHLESLPDGALLAWSHPLAESTLERVRNRVASNPDMRLRLHNAAASQATAFVEMAIQELVLAGPCKLNAPFGHVRELTLNTPLEQGTLAEVFPSLKALRVMAGAKRVNPRAIARVAGLEHLDLSHVSGGPETLEQLAPLAKLRALRVARLDGVRSLRGLDALTSVKTLSVEHLHLDTLAPLPLCASLEQLELHGMWQFTIDDMAWLPDLPRLVRAEIDIGGRRKNLELYRPGRYAYPWPTF